jgi:protein ImuA
VRLFATGHRQVDAFLGGGLAKGHVHEICATGDDDASAGAAFVALLALRAGDTGTTVMWLRTDRAMQRSGWLHAPGLAELGFDPAQLVLGLAKDDVALLRSAADAARCPGLGALIVECWGNPRALDLTASRRLVLAAETSGVTLLLLRVAAVADASAAETRWRVAAAPSVALEANAPGHPVFEVELTRRRAGPPGPVWRMEWSRDDRSFRDPALSGAVVPLPARRPAVHPDRNRRIA